MIIPPDISLAYVESELESAASVIAELDLQLDAELLSEDHLIFRVSGRSWVDEELYIVEFRCDDYRAKPPFVEMIDPDSGEAGTRHAYPDCFHTNGPCVCARFNRKTYVDHTGLHGDWKYEDWATESATDHFGGMISHIWQFVHGFRGNYSGRMG